MSIFMFLARRHKDQLHRNLSSLGGAVNDGAESRGRGDEAPAAAAGWQSGDLLGLCGSVTRLLFGLTVGALYISSLSPRFVVLFN